MPCQIIVGGNVPATGFIVALLAEFITTKTSRGLSAAWRLLVDLGDPILTIEDASIERVQARTFRWVMLKRKLSVQAADMAPPV